MVYTANGYSLQVGKFKQSSRISMLELAEMIIHLVGGKSKLVFSPLPADDLSNVNQYKLAKERLNWEPKVDLKEGLKKTINYFKDII
jgi:UDP-glucuronate decarboxylase